MTTETITIPTKPDEKEQTKDRHFPLYAVVIVNDDRHTFPYVIGTIIKVFKYSLDKAKKLTLEVHEKGRAIVWTGQKEHAELKKEQIQGCGPDLYASVKVDFPLKVDLEPIS